MKIDVKIGLVAVVLLSVLSGFTGAKYGIDWYPKAHAETVNDRVKNFYNDEMASVISPVDLRGLIDKKDQNYVLVDLRTKAEYDAEHIITAINIPAPNLDENQLLAEFNKIPKDKKIIVYCYSAYCTLGRQVGQFLANNGIYIRDLDAGWSEWRYYWGIWNPGEDSKVGEKYIIKGTNNLPNSPGSCTQGKFGC